LKKLLLNGFCANTLTPSGLASFLLDFIVRNAKPYMSEASVSLGAMPTAIQRRFWSKFQFFFHAFGPEGCQKILKRLCILTIKSKGIRRYKDLIKGDYKVDFHRRIPKKNIDFIVNG
jgi:hypothetical protein